MSVTRLDPPIPLDTPKGQGWAHFVIDYSQEHNLVWIVFVDETREIWAIPNAEARAVKSWTFGRRDPPVTVSSEDARTVPPWRTTNP